MWVRSEAEGPSLPWPLLWHCPPSTPTPPHQPPSLTPLPTPYWPSPPLLPTPPSFSTYDVDSGVSSCMMWGPRILCSWTRVSFRGLLSLGSETPSILWLASSSRISLSMSSALRGRGEGVRQCPRKSGPSSSSSEDAQGLSPAESVWAGECGSCPRRRALCKVSTTTFSPTEGPSSSSDQAGGSPRGRLLPLRIASPGSAGVLRRCGAWGSEGWERKVTSRRSRAEKVWQGCRRRAHGRRRLSGE